MKILRKILLATDFSKYSENMVDNAIDIAKLFESKIILIHVLPDRIKNDKVKALIKKAANAQLDILKEKIEKSGVEADTPIIKFGNHFDKIIQVSNKENVNLIIIGAGAKLKKDVFKLGTTAEKLVRRSDKPVLVVKKGSEFNKIKSVLCPVDFSEESTLALNNSINITRRYNSKLIILGVLEPNKLGFKGLNLKWDEIDALNRVDFEKEMTSYLENFNLIDVNYKTVIKTGDPATKILRTIKRKNTDLLVMGSSGKSNFHRMIMGSVTEKVIREVPCSFLTLKTENAIHVNIENRIKDIEEHLNDAKQLVKDGFYGEAIAEYQTCLKINDMHIPSLNGLSKLYEKMGNTELAEEYKKIAHEVIVRLWDDKIEREARKFYKF
jgi:nucleotide-binding universal stress UspA family protein